MTEEEKAFRKALAEVLGDVALSEAELASAYGRISARIKTRIRRGKTVTAFELARDIGGAFEVDFAARVNAIEAAVDNASQRGPLAGADAVLAAPRDLSTTYAIDASAVRKKLGALNGDEPGKWRYVLRDVPISQIEVRPVWQESKLPPIREAMAAQKALPPIRADLADNGLYAIEDGIHRVNVAIERGLTHVPAIVPELVEEAPVAPVTRAGQGARAGRARIRASRSAIGQASERIAARTTARPTVPISTRIRQADQQLGAELAREVTRGIQQGRGILGAAKEIQKLDTGFEARLPGYLREVEDAARAGNLPELKKLTKRYLSRAKKTLGELQVDGTRKASAYSLRSATQRFLRDIEKAGADGIDRVVGKYIEERAQYQARLIARHESVEAFREGYVRESRNKPGVIGYRWTTSSRHGKPDECDVFAKQNLYELGPGVYPPDDIPRRHPSCLCTLSTVIDQEHFSRPVGAAMPRDTRSPGAEEWLREHDGLARQILGPTRHAAFKEGVPVLDRDGRPRLVRELVGVREAAE